MNNHNILVLVTEAIREAHSAGKRLGYNEGYDAGTKESTNDEVRYLKEIIAAFEEKYGAV